MFHVCNCHSVTVALTSHSVPGARPCRPQTSGNPIPGRSLRNPRVLGGSIGGKWIDKTLVGYPWIGLEYLGVLRQRADACSICRSSAMVLLLGCMAASQSAPLLGSLFHTCRFKKYNNWCVYIYISNNKYPPIE